MSEYISRNEAHQELHQAGGCDASDEWARGYDAGITEAIDIIDNMPTADVAPVVHGHWESFVYNWPPFKCSRCRNERDWGAPFCERCGAKMDQEAENV